jgi:zinc protease
MFNYNPETKDAGLRHVFIKVNDEKDLAVVRDAINATYAKIRTEQVSAEKLDNLKSNLKYSFVNSLDSSEAIASTLASYMHFDRDPETINYLYNSFDNISAEDINRIANKYFIDENRTTVTMSALDKVSSFDQEVNLNGAVAKIEQAKANPSAPQFTVLDKSNDSPLIDVNFLFYTGAAADPAGKKGVAALMARMLTQGGSQTRSFKEIKKGLYPLAGSFSSQLDKEMMSFSGRVHKDNAAQWYQLISDQLLNPGWREDDFKRLKKELIESIKSGLKASNDEELGKEVLYSKLYQGHVYENFNSGDLSDLETITLEDVKAFYHSQLTQAKLNLGITGAMPETLKAQLMSDLSALPVGDDKR